MHVCWKRFDPGVRRALALVLWVVTCAGCEKKLIGDFLPNQPPTVRLTHAPVTTTSRNFYAYRLNWVGYDPDGTVDHYIYAVDPPNLDKPDDTWVRTTKNEETVFFRATTPDDPDSGQTRQVPFTSSDPHTFAIRAVDNRGLMSSTTTHRSFFSYTVAPEVVIELPKPATAYTTLVSPSVRIRWSGKDPDGVFTLKPVAYKFRLFGRFNPDKPQLKDGFIQWALSNPDSFRTLYAPHFEGWQESPGDTTETLYTNLTPEEEYLFAITAIDEAGAYTPVFDPAQNFLRFAVTFAGELGPRITLFNEFFNYTYVTGGPNVDQSRWIVIEVPAHQKVTFNWSASLGHSGAEMRSFRWVMSSPPLHPFDDLEDETPRTNEETDWWHWSRKSINTTSATVGPFNTNGEQHFFYVEAEDNNGLVSRGVVYFTVADATFDKELLIVDDTRLTTDRFDSQGQLVPPTGVPWPTAAELDTFFYARGGFPWKGYPEGTLSTPGIFNGYDFDTLGSRGEIGGIVKLSKLGQYKHVLWYTDITGSTNNGRWLDPVSPITALRLISSPGQPSTLSTYIKQGGVVWLMGGGAANATLAPWDKAGSVAGEYTNRDGELIPGRFMYDFSHWQTAIRVGPATAARKFVPANFPQTAAFPFSRWNDPGIAPGRGWPGQPDYSSLPQNLNARIISNGLDPPPPLRNPDSFWFRNDYIAEYLTDPNFIREDPDGNAETPGELSTLDTLYFATGASTNGPRPVMTYYHPARMSYPTHPDTIARPLLFSGLPLWFFRRSQEIPVLDFVFQQLWGYTRRPVSREPVRPARAAGVAGGAARAGVVARPVEPVRPMRHGQDSGDR